MVGLAVMGRNLVLNMADKGFSVAAYNRTASVTEEFASTIQEGQHVQACYSLEEFIGSLARPRKIMLMVKAGAAVDAVIGSLEPLLDPGDIVIDGGNSYFGDTQRRGQDLSQKGIHFLGVGISGGEYGARNGPSMMPGGQKEAYDAVARIFEAVAADVDGEPCVRYLGPDGAGHYVKMVHNGIEYGIMEAISETYALMKQALGVTNEELARVYDDWNKRELESYLVEITAKIFGHRDEFTKGHLIDVILGEAEQLGTGMWTSQSAMDLHVPVPNIDVAVAMRSLSTLGDERRSAVTLLAPAADEAPPALVRGGDGTTRGRGKAYVGVDKIRDALYATMVITYAQGFAQLQVASEALEFGLDLTDVATVWRGGCIIRAALLGKIRDAFKNHGGLRNLLLDLALADEVVSRRSQLVSTIETAMTAGVPVPALMTALAYLDAFRAQWLAVEPDPGSTGLLRGSYLQADRSRRRLPHGVARRMNRRAFNSGPLGLLVADVDGTLLASDRTLRPRTEQAVRSSAHAGSSSLSSAAGHPEGCLFSFGRWRSPLPWRVSTGACSLSRICPFSTDMPSLAHRRPDSRSHPGTRTRGLGLR